MLVLSRKKNEAIHIGEDITIRVVAVRGNRVQLAIDAPEQFRILRGEIAITAGLDSVDAGPGGGGPQRSLAMSPAA
jgi:carbon storage regulator CsrA